MIKMGIIIIISLKTGLYFYLTTLQYSKGGWVCIHYKISEVFIDPQGYFLLKIMVKSFKKASCLK